MAIKRTFILALPILMLLLGCDKYTAPSPIDGIWRMVDIINHTGETIPIPDEAIAYWDFSNVIYTVSYQPKGNPTIMRMGYGNIYFERDIMILKTHEGKPHFFPVPSTDKLSQVSFKYRVWDGKLTLIATNYTIYLEKK